MGPSKHRVLGACRGHTSKSRCHLGPRQVDGREGGGLSSAGDRGPGCGQWRPWTLSCRWLPPRAQECSPALSGRGREVTSTCVRVLHQAEDHTGLLIDIEAQGILLLGHVDEEVGVSVHWGHSME